MKRRRLFFICLVLLFGGGYFYHSHSLSAKAEPAWRKVAPGIELRSFARTGNYGAAKILAVRVDPVKAIIRVVKIKKGDPPGARAEAVCPARGAAINGSFFAEEPFMQPMGLLVCDGKKLQKRFPVGEWGTFLVTAKGAAIIKSADKLPAGVKQAVEGKPRLVVDGKISRFKSQPAARRSAVGLDAKGRVMLAATDGFWTLEQWAAVMKADLNCVKALNLDGGPSTQLCVKGDASQTIPGGWPVPVLITAEPR
jgi:uncharacterized protein YigE (DUF2233 family)